MTLVAGSYEQFVLAYSYTNSLGLAPLFSSHSHHSVVKAVAVAGAGSTTVSGGYDETIKVYDLASSSEIDSVFHNSPITSLSFFRDDLIAADAEGFVSIYSRDPFVKRKKVKFSKVGTVKVHAKAVNSVSLHPSGNLALTVGHDDCLAIVDLGKGTRECCCNFGKEASIVQYNKIGDKFFMVVDEKISVHEAEDTKLILELDSNKSVLCIASGANGIVFAGGEDKNVTGWDTASGKVAYRIEDAHTMRVKGIVVLSKNGVHSGEDDPYKVVSASSDGLIRVWDIRMGNKGHPNPLAEVNTKARLTCLAGSSIKCKPVCIQL